MAGYLATQVSDESHRDVTGPLLNGSGASGLVVHGGRMLAEWGDIHRPEMLFSATKSVVSLVAGLAYDRGILELDSPVGRSVDLAEFSGGDAAAITWRHLLQQTSQWNGTLWDKPAAVDAQSRREGTESAGGPPGAGWAYNDVRVNLLTLALTALLGAPLGDVLGDFVLAPIGGSNSWSWHGYRDSVVQLGDQTVVVVSGGAHWGGGLWMSAADLALLGELYLRRGRWGDRVVVSERWLELSWTPCAVKPEYGFLWWLNDQGTILPAAPESGRCARGNGGRHLLWVDPERDLVIVSRWGDGVELLVAAVSAAVRRVASERVDGS